MTFNIDQLKKKIIYRSNYRGTKEMDKLLGAFTKKYINQLSQDELIDLMKKNNFKIAVVGIGYGLLSSNSACFFIKANVNLVINVLLPIFMTWFTCGVTVNVWRW